eukprot:3828945-Alexandrium_andersonii.AAC.1
MRGIMPALAKDPRLLALGHCGVGHIKSSNHPELARQSSISHHRSIQTSPEPNVIRTPPRNSPKSCPAREQHPKHIRNSSEHHSSIIRKPSCIIESQ